MSDMEKVKKGLSVCTSAEPCNGCPYLGERNCGLAMVRDALALLKEQENEIEVSVPEQFQSSMQYDPSEDVVACTSCLICGKDIPLRRYESGPKVCSECKEAVTAMKRERRKEND